MITGRYADVIVDISHEKVDRPFQYRIPQPLLGKISPGMCVVVPFGKGDRERTGYVIGVTDRPGYDEDKIKEILRIADKGAIWFDDDHCAEDSAAGKAKDESADKAPNLIGGIFR